MSIEALSAGQTELDSVFIVLHALAGITCFLAGSVTLTTKYSPASTWFSFYIWSLIAMVAFLGGAMVLRWNLYSGMEQIVFSGLLALAGYMIYRGNAARSIRQQGGDSSKFIHHIGFTLIALFEGFIIVLLLNLDAPGWVVAIAAMSGLVVGRMAIGRAESKVSTTPYGWSVGENVIGK